MERERVRLEQRKAQTREYAKETIAKEEAAARAAAEVSQLSKYFVMP